MLGYLSSESRSAAWNYLVILASALIFHKGTTQNALTSFGIIPAILGYALYTVMISVLLTLVYIMSNGSVFGSILLHTVGNLSLGVVPLIFSKNGAVIVLLTFALL